MKSYKNGAIIFGILTAVLLIAGVIITWKWVQLRKNVAKVATNTTAPTSAAINASVASINSQAANVNG